MGLRPGHCYSEKKDRAYCRVAVKVHKRNYIGAVPGLKTRQFNMGNSMKAFSHILDLAVEAHCQVRDNAIESARMAINRYLVKTVGKEGFFMKIRVYPHHILRENKQAQGAHADRIQQGMSQAFGKPIGRAARVRPGQKIISVLVDEKGLAAAEEALIRAKDRFPCEVSVRIGKDVESIGTKPRKVKLEQAVKAAEEEAKEGEQKKEGKEGEKKDGEEGEKKEGAPPGKEGAEKKEAPKGTEKK